MDQDKLSYFVSRYRALDADELSDLHGRRGTLADEAIVALDTVLAEKGIDKGILARYSQKPFGVEMPTEAELARDLSKGKLAMACKLAFMMTAWSPVNYALNRSGVLLGALWVGLLVVALGYAGYRVGHAVTRSICASENTTYAQKKRGLWFLLLGVIALYFVLFAVVGSIVPSAK